MTIEIYKWPVQTPGQSGPAIGIVTKWGSLHSPNYIRPADK